MRLRRVGRIFSLPRAELLALVRAQAALIAARWMVRSRPAGDLLAWDGTTRSERPGATVDETRARAIERAVSRAADNGPVRATCLVRALAIQRMLGKSGLDPGRIRVGVRIVGDRFDAHAWVETGGLVLGDRLPHVRSFEPLADARMRAR